MTDYSICIPNYNYARYIGETIASVRAQTVDLEILVSDNASTDDSVAVVEAFCDERIRVARNRWNVGFAGNLDRACAGATGDRMILLSSDDLMMPGALATYSRLSEMLGEDASDSIYGSTQNMISGSGEKIATMGRDPRMWRAAQQDNRLSEAVGAPVYRIAAADLLRASLLDLRTPLHFATTCYPRTLFEAVEGYGSGYLINPDKAFVWKVLAKAEWAFFVDTPLFEYRWHEGNQTAQEQQSGALKHLVDQYRATFDTAADILERASLSRDDLADAFVDHEIGLRNLKRVAEGQRLLARRGLHFGIAAYPDRVRRSKSVMLLRLLLALGPIGTALARRAQASAMEKYRASSAERTQ